MYLTQFPDINFVKDLANKKVKKQKAGIQVDLEKDGWPNVILNVQSRRATRENIRSPFSIFMNVTGNSSCTVDKRNYTLDSNYFLLVNEDQYYDLHVDTQENTELFNIHLGEQFCRDVINSTAYSNETLLDSPDKSVSSIPEINTQLYEKDRTILETITQLKHLKNDEHYHAYEAELLSELYLYVQSVNQNMDQQKLRLENTKKYIRDEIFKRMMVAKDYIISNYNKPIDLNQISHQSCFSKYHFLRLFKQLYQITPQQFINKIRLEKAKELVTNTTYSLQDISLMVGYEYHASLTRAFKKHYHVSPTSLRKNSNIG